MSLEAVRCLVRALGFRKVSPRPLHPKADPQAQEDFRLDFSELAMSALPEGTDPASVDIWCQEARIGQKGMLARVWALRGSRPRVTRDHRYGYCYLFSAICPDDGAAVGHVCGRANTQEMNRHLLDIGAAVPDGRHALVVLDGAGWHRSRDLDCPENVPVLRLPPYSPEPDPVETVFRFLKARHFASQVFETAEAVTERVAEVWESFAASPDRIRSIGHGHVSHPMPRRRIKAMFMCENFLGLVSLPVPSPECMMCVGQHLNCENQVRLRMETGQFHPNSSHGLPMTHWERRRTHDDLDELPGGRTHSAQDQR